jgi:hypothetical protein
MKPKIQNIDDGKKKIGKSINIKNYPERDL